jgi:hypothetical protein
VQAFRARQGRSVPAVYPLCAGRAYLAAGQIDEATGYAREALALARRSGARGIEAYALSLTADIAAASGAENAEDYYREACLCFMDSGPPRSSKRYGDASGECRCVQ